MSHPPIHISLSTAVDLLKVIKAPASQLVVIETSSPEVALSRIPLALELAMHTGNPVASAYIPPQSATDSAAETPASKIEPADAPETAETSAASVSVLFYPGQCVRWINGRTGKVLSVSAEIGKPVTYAVEFGMGVNAQRMILPHSDLYAA